MKGNVAQKLSGNLFHRGLQMLFMGCVTGFLVGVIVTFYNILASIGEDFSSGIYAYVREHWFLIPVLFVALACAAFLIGVIVKFVPMVRGSGIPQTEGVSRGALKYNWFTTMCTMFASSLACVFLGLSAGGEGPSIMIGGACGYGSARLFSRTDMQRRYQTTGGACAGLAVAFNAPLTGMAFAFEEAHKRFTPEVFICAFSSVVTGVITRNVIRSSLGYSVGAVLDTYVLVDFDSYVQYWYIAVAAIVSALVGIGFYYAVLALKKLIAQKVTFCKGIGKMLIPFLAAGVFGLITVYSMGGGHALLEALGTSGGTQEMELESALGLGIVGTLVLALAFKFVASLLNMSCGVPCGVFIPMLAIGASVGALLSELFINCFGMDAANADLIVMICMAAFFTCVVRAPITGIVMVIELTWSFTALLPIVLGVALGYMVGEIFRTQPIYEALLEQILEEKNAGKEKKMVECTVSVQEDSILDGLTVQNVLWPAGTALKTVVRGEEVIIPHADTVLHARDVLSLAAETYDEEGTIREFMLLAGEKYRSVLKKRKRKEHNGGETSDGGDENSSGSE